MTHIVPQCVAIDNGYYNTKVYTGESKFSFRSKYEETEDTNINTTNTYQLTFDNKKYLIGDGGCNYNVEIDKTNNLLHKLITYTTLGLLNNKNSTTSNQSSMVYNLVTMLPLQFYNSTNKHSFTEYLQTKEPIDIVVNNKSSKIYINKLLVLPQCATVLYNNPQEYKNQLVGIVDIGGLTVQGCIFNNLSLVRESIFSFNGGAIILYEKIKKKLNAKHNINLQDYEIPYVLNETKYLLDIESIVTNHLEEIRNQMKKNNWNIELLPIMFTGGTSVELINYLTMVFPTSFISQDGLYDNVRGAYKVGEIQFNK